MDWKIDLSTFELLVLGFVVNDRGEQQPGALTVYFMFCDAEEANGQPA